MSTSFAQYLNEDGSGFSKPKKLTDQEFVDWCETHASAYLKRIKMFNPLYRGMNLSEKYSIIDTNGFNRVSAHSDSNSYTLWMDNNPSWKNFPKRSKSLVCTTSASTAESYGDIFLIVPADSSLMGICPANDLWNSFDAIQSLGPYMERIDELIRDLIPGEDLSTYDSLEKAFKECTVEVLRADPHDHYHLSSNLVKICDKEGYKNLYDYFLSVLNPVTNEFRVGKPASINAPFNSEVWVQGECAALNLNFANGKVMSNFLDKYDIENSADH